VYIYNRSGNGYRSLLVSDANDVTRACAKEREECWVRLTWRGHRGGQWSLQPRGDDQLTSRGRGGLSRVLITTIVRRYGQWPLQMGHGRPWIRVLPLFSRPTRCDYRCKLCCNGCCKRCADICTVYLLEYISCCQDCSQCLAVKDRVS